MQRTRWGTARIGILTATVAVLSVAWLWPSTDSRGGLKDNKAPDNKVSDKEDRVLTTQDGVKLHVSYYKSSMEKDAAVVVLLHMKDGNRFVWQTDDGFARRLQNDGFAVVTVDLRSHGENKASGAAAAGNANQAGAGKKKGKKAQGLELKLGDYDAMWELDMEAVKAFIYSEHQAGNLNMTKMGIVGPEMGASVAAAYAVLDWSKEPYDDGQPGFQTPRGQDIRALVLISPEEKYHGIKMPILLPILKDNDKQIAILICSGNDVKEEAQAKKIYDMVKPPAALEKADKDSDQQKYKRMYFTSFPAKLTGTDLLDQKLGIEEAMLGFFDRHLKKLEIPWRDRKNKRDRPKKN